MDGRRALGVGLLAVWLASCASGAGSAGRGEAATRASGAIAPAGATGTAPTESAAPSAALEKIVLALPVVTGVFVPHVLAEQRGFFAEEGLTAEFPIMKTNLVVTALSSGEADYNGMFSPSIPPILSGMPHRVLAATVDKSTRQLMVGPGVQSVEQLRGKAIAVSQLGGGPYNSGVLAMEHFGIDPRSEVTWLALGGTNERMLAMQQGSAQASIYSGSEIPRADALGFKTLVYLNDVAPLPESGMTTSVAKLESQRDQVKRVLRATVRALQYLKANRAGSLPVLADFMQVPPDEAEMAYDGMVAAYSDDGTVSQQSLRYTIDAVKQEVGVTGEVATTGIVDFAPLYEVLGEMGITPGADRAR